MIVVFLYSFCDSFLTVTRTILHWSENAAHPAVSKFVLF